MVDKQDLKEVFKDIDDKLQKNIQLPKGIVDVSGTSEIIWNACKKLRKEDK